jgi:hypothetical protein
MKKPVKKKSAVKKAKKASKAKKAKKAKKARKARKSSKSKKTSKSRKQAAASAAQGDVENGMVDKQPKVKEQAAVAHAMFLFVDDAWALRYFDQNDLHFLEREVFG